MLRKIWHRAAALALPLALAICLPPLAVIALNLRAQSTAAAPTTTQSTRTTADVARERGNKEASRNVNQSRQRETAPAQQVRTATLSGNQS